MTEDEWLASDDPIAMLEALRANWRGEEDGLVRLTHRYLLACCRAIWTLLPLEESRQGVEVAERYIEGQATREEFAAADYQAEGAAFYLEPEISFPEGQRWDDEEWTPEIKESYRQYEADRKARIELLINGFGTIPVEEMRRMVRSPAGVDPVPSRQLLANAAYFADFAMVYPGVRPREGAIERYRQFLSATLLRTLVASPFRR